MQILRAVQGLFNLELADHFPPHTQIRKHHAGILLIASSSNPRCDQKKLSRQASGAGNQSEFLRGKSPLFVSTRALARSFSCLPLAPPPRCPSSPPRSPVALARNRYHSTEERKRKVRDGGNSRVTYLDGKNLQLTYILDVPPSCLGRRYPQNQPDSCRNSPNQGRQKDFTIQMYFTVPAEVFSPFSFTDCGQLALA